MRTHLNNTIAHTTDPVTLTHMDPADTSAPAANHPSVQTATTTHDTGHTPVPPSPSPLTTHTPQVNKGQKRTPPTPDDGHEQTRTKGKHAVCSYRTSARQRTKQLRVRTLHMVARDCAPNLHWEGDRNDQCEACNQGGTLTECTRCNIVWHASCLVPPLPFPLRPQDEIVCQRRVLDRTGTSDTGSWRDDAPAGRPKYLSEVSTPHTSTHQYPACTLPDHLTQPTHTGHSPQHKADYLRPHKHITSPLSKQTK